jgi:hypothetical protein
MFLHRRHTIHFVIITMVMMHLLTDTTESDDGMRYIEIRDAIVSAPGQYHPTSPAGHRPFHVDRHSVWPAFSPRTTSASAVPQAALQSAPSPRGQIFGMGHLRGRIEPSRV